MRLVENCSSAKFAESLGFFWVFCYILLENKKIFGHRGALFKKNKPQTKQKISRSRIVAVSGPVQILEAPGRPRAKSSLRSALLTWTQKMLFPKDFV